MPTNKIVTPAASVAAFLRYAKEGHEQLTLFGAAYGLSSPRMKDLLQALEQGTPLPDLTVRDPFSYKRLKEATGTLAAA